jgi:Lhr-like helicase
MGGHVFIQAPAGSGQTLTAFMVGIDRLHDSPGDGLQPGR